MGYTVAHIDKVKSGASGGLTSHIDRTQNRTSENIDTSRTHKNFELCNITGSIDETIKQRIVDGYKGTKAVRKDAVTSMRYILSGSHEDMVKWDDLTIKQWAIDNYKYFAEKHGEKNIVRATVHLDEKTPHMHLIVVPLTPDGRLSAKDFIGTKTKLKDFHTDYAQKIGVKYGLDRGVEGNNRKHLTTHDFYRYMQSNEFTAEQILQSKNGKEIIGKLLEIADVDKEKLYKISHKKIRENEHRGHRETSTGRESKKGQDKRSGFKTDLGN